MYRQGDVLIIPAGEIPAGARAVPRERHGTDELVVLAHGEVTGHAHAIAEAGVDLFEIDQVTPGSTAAAVERWLRVQGGATVVHEEHAPITLPDGNYRVIRQREYQPGPVVSRAVAD